MAEWYLNKFYEFEVLTFDFKDNLEIYGPLRALI